jgi:hypothetical protein
MITYASAAPTRQYNGIQYAGTYDAYEMHVYSPSGTPGTTPDVLKQVIHFDGTDTVTFLQEANGKITAQTYRLDAKKTTMTLDESCSDASFKSMPYYFYATTVGSPGNQFDEIEWPSSQGPGYAVYIVYRKPH